LPELLNNFVLSGLSPKTQTGRRTAGQRTLKNGGLEKEEMKEPGENRNSKLTTTIAIWKSTKEKLDKNRAPGQCYNGFICQLINLWEKTGQEKLFMRASSDGERGGIEE
jgi:hypothetical protein